MLRPGECFFFFLLFFLADVGEDSVLAWWIRSSPSNGARDVKLFFPCRSSDAERLGERTSWSPEASSVQAGSTERIVLDRNAGLAGAWHVLGEWLKKEAFCM